MNAAARPSEPDRPAAAVAIRHLTHRYDKRDRPALDDVSLDVGRGERIGLLGPNGAGKSTLMRILSGFLRVQAGVQTRVEVVGHDLCHSSRRDFPRVGYLPEHVPLYAELRVREHLEFRARLKGIVSRERVQELARVAEATTIADVLDVPIFELSRGFRQRVGIADALLGRPALLMLDEPTVGLDPNQILEIRRTLRTIGDEQTLIFSTHILGEVEMLCDRVVILHQGRRVADECITDALRSRTLVVEWNRGSEGELRDVVHEAAARLGIDSDMRLLFETLTPHPRVRVEVQSPDPTSERALAAIGEASAGRGLLLRRLEMERPRLEQHFARVTGAVSGERAEP